MDACNCPLTKIFQDFLKQCSCASLTTERSALLILPKKLPAWKFNKKVYVKRVLAFIGVIAGW